MDVFLSALEKSVKHLQIIDEVFSTSDYPEKDIYNEIKREIKTTNLNINSNKFSEELYVGGKKRNSSSNQGYARQMILSDMLEYIVNGRGYFYAVRNKQAMKNYIKIIIDLINQLMIIDSIVVEVTIRKKLLEKFQEDLGEEFFKDDDRKKEHEALLLHEYPIGFPLENPQVSAEVLEKLGLNESQKDKAIGILETYYDSLLPKTAGGLWGELIVYLYLLRKNLGFVFPLVLNQRLITGDSKVYLKPPDFLLLPFGKEIFYGIEVGGGKEMQSGTFSITTGIPTATKVNMDNPKRCCICGKWMLFCPQIVEDYSDTDKQIENFKKPIKCINECRKFTPDQILSGACSYAMHKGGKPTTHVMKMKGDVYHFHLKCLMQDEAGRNDISESKIVSYYPYVGGLEEFEKLQLDTTNIETKINEMKSLISKSNEEKSED